MPRQTTDDARWQAAIAEFRRSGMTQPEFCRRRGLPLHTFRRRLYARPSAPPSPGAAEPLPPAVASPEAPRFVPVTRVSCPPLAATADLLVLILDGRHRIAVAQHRNDAAALAELETYALRNQPGDH